jgi:hypothetical protein
MKSKLYELLDNNVADADGVESETNNNVQGC